MSYLSIENVGRNTAEIEVQSADSTSQTYLEPDQTFEAGRGYLVTLRSAEGGGLTLVLSNSAELLVHQMFTVRASTTRRHRTLALGRKRRVRIDGDERLVLIPVGQRED